MAGHDRLAHKQALSLSVTQLLSNRPLLYEGEQDTASLLTPLTMTETKEGRIFEEDVDSTKHALAQMVIPSPSSPGNWQWVTVSPCISGYISCMGTGRHRRTGAIVHRFHVHAYVQHRNKDTHSPHSYCQ